MKVLVSSAVLLLLLLEALGWGDAKISKKFFDVGDSKKKSEHDPSSPSVRKAPNKSLKVQIGQCLLALLVIQTNFVSFPS